MKTVLSVDVAKNKSMIMLMNSDGEILIDTKEINHNLEDFEKVKEDIKEINTNNVKKMADIIINEAIDNGYGVLKDDMTVIVAKVNKI